MNRSGKTYDDGIVDGGVGGMMIGFLLALVVLCLMVKMVVIDYLTIL